MTIWRFIKTKIIPSIKEYFKSEEKPAATYKVYVKPEKIEPKKEYRLKPCDIKYNDVIRCYLDKYDLEDGRVRSATCISNDKQTESMLLKYTFLSRDQHGVYKNFPAEKVFNYNSFTFNNFHVLNPHLHKKELPIDNLQKLQKQVKEAIQSENWQRVDNLNDEIEKLGNRAPEL